MNKSGDFFTLISLNEDDFEVSRSQPTIQFDTRIRTATEALLHCANVYRVLGVDPNAHVEVAVRYAGLRGRILRPYDEARYLGVVAGENTLEDEVSTAVIFRLGAIDSLMVQTVRKLCEPLFVVFNFATVPTEIYKQIVTDFVNGKVS